MPLIRQMLILLLMPPRHACRSVSPFMPQIIADAFRAAFDASLFIDAFRHDRARQLDIAS